MNTYDVSPTARLTRPGAADQGAQFALLHATLADVLGLAHMPAHLDPRVRQAIDDAAAAGIAGQIAAWIEDALDVGLTRGRQVERNTRTGTNDPR
ncbi:hypothetical protein [Myceligenerans pegani]|uniref:Uncharacterized protein n=1 Tax=Myceligenerans pegani TaxID=2776917 RepID=A0ABR9N477_9MICO|nr:hypothetical protein [Myceligenerans sp. TRM 65318]MBE1878475.1 hypothetical protein [Myceligenerans sp. TRM 65318]MBE3020746.1 hypothetical protein [Myceligenerans sp. TRM 65318]